MMELSIGQKVAYPTQGVCMVEDITRQKIGNDLINCYFLRVLRDNSTICVPTAKAETVGIRPVISPGELRKLISFLGADFDDIPHDWKIRSREFSSKIQSGDVFEIADVLKKLTFLSQEKRLSFRERTFLEKAKFLLVSEVKNADLSGSVDIEESIDQLLERACRKHQTALPKAMTAAGH